MRLISWTLRSGSEHPATYKRCVEYKLTVLRDTWKYRLSVLNGNPDFLHIVIHTFVTLCYKQCWELQLSTLNNTGSVNSPH
jgi:hypothetical protein